MGTILYQWVSNFDSLFTRCKMCQAGASQVAQWVKVLASKPSSLGLVPRLYKVGERTDSHRLLSDSACSLCYPYTHK